MITTNTSLQELFNHAVQSLADVQPGEQFIVRDLFRGFEWKRIARGDRTKLGSMFFAYIGSKGQNMATPLGKTAQNQQIYQRI